MAISRVPGYSLLANLDRQGTDIGITSSGLYVTYWDVVNYRFGVNNSAPQQALDVTGNIITSNGHVYTNANISFDIGDNTNWWRTAYAQNVQAVNLTGTLLTSAQPNITSIGTLSNVTVSGNIVTTGNIVANGISVIGYGLINTSGNIIGAAGLFSSVNSTGLINTSGNVLASVYSGGQVRVTGLINTTGNVLAAIYSGGQVAVTGLINTAGNIIAATANVSQLGVITNISAGGFINATGNIIGAAGSFGTVTTTGNISATNGWVNAGTLNVTGNIQASRLTVGNITTTNSINTSNIFSTSDITIQTLSSGNINLNANSTGIVKINGTDAVGIPAGAISDRPINPAAGYLRFNTDNDIIEFYDGTGWVQPSLASTISSQTINPDGVANTYILGSNTTTQGVLVSINGTLQQPITSYNIVSNNQIVFTETPLTTDTVEVRFLSGQAYSVSSLKFGTTTSVELDPTSINIVGNIQTTGFYNNKPNLLISTTATTTIDSYYTTSYRTAKYLIQAVLGSNVESYEFLVTHNGTTAASTTYGVLTLGNSLGNISATLTSGNVNVQYTPFASNTYLTVSRTFYPL